MLTGSFKDLYRHLPMEFSLVSTRGNFLLEIIA
jgi:hypothetical protein